MVNLVSKIKDLAVSLWSKLEFRFILVGGFNTVFGYLLSILIYQLLENILHIVAISVINNIILITISFINLRILVFKSKGSWLIEYGRMYIVNGVSLIANTILIWIAVDRLKIPFWLAQGAITVFLAILMFFAHKLFTFNNR